MGSSIGSNTPPRPREECFSGVKDGCFLVRWLRIHCFINLFRTICRPLTKKEFFNTTSDLVPEHNYTRFCELRSKHPNDGFGRTIFQRQFLLALLWASFVAMVAAGLGYAGPVFLKHIIGFISKKKPAENEEGRAYMFAALWFVAYLFRIFFDQQAQWNAFSVATKVQQIINMVVHDKMMKMSTADRRLFEEGDFMTFFNVDTRIVTTFAKSFYILFSAPTTLITTQVFLFIDTGKYGLIMTGVILASLIFQVCICWRVAKLGVSKLGHFQNRIASNIEFFSNLKQIKSLGWEDLIAKQNKEMRKSENYYNQRIFLYNSIYNFIVSFAPTLTIFLILVIHLAANRHSPFTTTYIYTLISYIGLIYGPINSLPSTIISAIQTSECCKRMDKLIAIEEVQEKPASTFIPGQLTIKNYIASWTSWKPKTTMFLSTMNGTIPTNSQIVKQSSKISTANPVVIRESLESAWNLCHNVDENIKNGEFKIKVPFEVDLRPGERLIVIGGNNSGKSSFLQSILGNTVQEYGSLIVGGKLGYVSQTPFLRRDTIKNNIVFDGVENKERLDMVEEFVDISSELNLIEKYDSVILEDVSVVLSPSMRQKISLARAIYHDPDIFLIDDVFTDMEIGAVRRMLRQFEKLFPQKTIVISTALTSIIRPNDQVIVFDQGSAVEHGIYAEMVGNPSSTIHQFRKEESALLEKMHLLASKLAGQHNSKQKNISMKAISAGKSGLSGSALYRKTHETNMLAHPKPPTAPERFKGVPLKFFFKFMRSGYVWLFILLVLMIAAGQALNVFSIWWIGSARVTYPQMNISAIIGVYVGAVCGYGLLSFICGLLITCMSIISTESLASRIISNVGKADLSWVDKQNKLFMTIILSRDNEEMYTVYNYYQAIFSNFFFFLGILILNGISNGLFFILGFAVLLINWLAVVLYIQAERQIFWAGIAIMREINNVLEDNIIGVDVIKAYGRASQRRQVFVDLLYKFNTVYKCNSRWLLQALSIIADVTGLATTFGSALFGIHNKFTSKNTTVIASAITLSNRLSSISSNISRDLANLQIQTRLTVNLPFTYGGKQPQLNYDTPEAPNNWPHNGSVRFDHVTFKDAQFEEPLINNFSFEAKSCTRVSVTSNHRSTAVETLMMLINKLRIPNDGENNYPGQVFVGDVPLDKIGRKRKDWLMADIRQHVQMYDHSPFMFTSSLRNNIDPFGKYSDEEIRRALEKVGLWNEPAFFNAKGLSTADTTTKLAYRIEDGGINVSPGHRQLINISRAILQKPRVILCDHVSSAIAPKYRPQLNQLLLHEFKDSTIFISSFDPSVLPHVDQLINLDTGESQAQIRSSQIPGGSDFLPSFQANPGTTPTLRNIPSIANNL